jgi:hypothetical protein
MTPNLCVIGVGRRSHCVTQHLLVPSLRLSDGLFSREIRRSRFE